MTYTPKHTTAEYLAWIDYELNWLGEGEIVVGRNFRASLLANRDVLGLHCASSEPDNYETIGCVACGYDSEYNQYLQKFPCPTRQAITNRIREVM